MNKKYLFGIMALFAVGLVSAGYLVNSFYFTVGVAEPFTVQYAVLGDGGDYDSSTDGTCAAPTDATWFSSTEESIPTGDMFPGESRKLCVKIVNEGESPIRYDVTSKIKEGIGNYVDCALAFPEETMTGDAVGSDTTTDGLEFTVPGDAPIVTGCQVGISVTRG